MKSKDIIRAIVVFRELQRHNKDMLVMIERSIGINKLAIETLRKVLDDPLYFKDN